MKKNARSNGNEESTDQNVQLVKSASKVSLKNEKKDQKKKEKWKKCKCEKGFPGHKPRDFSNVKIKRRF